MIQQLHDDDQLGAPRVRASKDCIASEAFPVTMRFKPAPYRAAYWRASNRSFGGLLLTERGYLAMPPSMLVRAARENAASFGLLLGGGEIVIIGCDGKDQPQVQA